MTTATPSPRSAFALAVIENGTHNPHIHALLEAVETRQVSDLAVQTQCAMIKIISGAVINQAQMDGTLVRDAKNKTILSLPLDDFDREIKALVHLGSQMKFSLALIDMIEQRLILLARQMAQHTRHADMQVRWNTLDDGGRLGYLQTINTLQMASFSDEDLRFTPAQLVCHNLPSRIVGEFDFDGPPLDPASRPRIAINPRHLDTASCAEMTGIMVHEGLHSILRQLARHHHFGTMAADHPFSADGALMETRIQTGAYLPSYLGKAYYADAEERICYRHTKFDGLYRSQSRHSAPSPAPARLTI
ncbi:MAG: hypothetical protein NDJ24_07405 [Alphaproteobacteria bacterium]|nr:hypothetical protein [Alphaproteobacteria bacterium]